MARLSELQAKLAKRGAVKAAMPLHQAVIATGRMVYEWRTAAKLSQAALADAIGTQQESISRIERGLSQEGPKLSTLAAIARACGRRLVIGSAPSRQSSRDEESEAASAWLVGDELFSQLSRKVEETLGQAHGRQGN